ncbi:MAG: FAD:protein FMN transferase, partial [Thermotogota bacterium]|nr:FAD:protein FMN transferase [Thermotogota bacterium]
MHNLRVYLYIAAVGVGIFLLSLLLFSKPSPVYEEQEFPVLGTIVRVKVAGDKVSSNVLLNTAEQELYRIHNKFSPNVEGSVVQKLNADRKVEVD